MTRIGHDGLLAHNLFLRALDSTYCFHELAGESKTSDISCSETRFLKVKSNCEGHQGGK